MCIRDRNQVGDAAIPDFLGILHVELFKNRPVKLGGVGAGADVKDELDFLLILVQPVEEFATFDALLNGFAFQIVQLFELGERCV